MANIQKRTNKDGKVSYRIRAFAGETPAGKKITKSMTYTPADGMTARQIEKAVQKAALDFERHVQQGGLVADSMTVDELLAKWFKEYAEPQLKPQTVSDYKRLVPRISAAIGHIKLNKLRPGHLMQFYTQLQQPGVRMDGKYKATASFIKKFPKGKRKALVAAAGVAERTAARIWAGESTSLHTAQKLAEAPMCPSRKPLSIHPKVKNCPATAPGIIIGCCPACSIRRFGGSSWQRTPAPAWIRPKWKQRMYNTWMNRGLPSC